MNLARTTDHRFLLIDDTNPESDQAQGADTLGAAAGNDTDGASTVLDDVSRSGMQTPPGTPWFINKCLL